MHASLGSPDKEAQRHERWQAVMARTSATDRTMDGENAHKESVALAIAELDWEIGVVDRNCRKLLRVLHAGNNCSNTYAGTSAATPSGRVTLKEQLDALQLEKAAYLEKKLALLQNLRPQHAGIPGRGP